MSGPEKHTRMLLVDDHQIVTQGLKYTLELEPDLEVVGQAADGATAVRLVQELEPDVVLLDLKLKNETGIEVCRRIVEVRPQAKVVILTTYMEEESLFKCITAGAKGYVLKDVELDELKRIVRLVAAGQSVLDPQITERVMERLRSGEEPSPEQAGQVQLTPRQLQVLELLTEGHTNKSIGEQLYLSESTVKYHVRHAMDLLGVERRAELVREVMRRGLLG